MLIAESGKHTKVVVSKLPECDFCKSDGETKTACYDGKTCYGPWAYMCSYHYSLVGIGLGLGKGQMLVLKQETEK